MIRQAALLLFVYAVAIAAHSDDADHSHNKVNDWVASPPVPGSATAEECSGDVFPDKMVVQFADFSIEYKGNYKVLTNNLENKKYVLWQRGCTQPTTETGVTEYFEVPLTTVWSESSTINQVLEFVGERRALRVVQGFYTSSPCIHKQNLDGYTLDAAYGLNWDVDNEHWCTADWTGVCSGVAQQFEDLGIDGVLNWDYPGNSLSGRVPHEIRMSDTSEDTFLKISEWNKYLAAFFNREKEIENFDTEMRARWVCNSKAAEGIAAADKRKVLYLDHLWDSTSGSFTKDYKVATCTPDKAQYRYCELLKAANTIPANQDVSALTAKGYTISSDTGEVLGISGADVVAWAADVDVIIFAQTWCPGVDGNETDCAREFDIILEVLKGIKAVDNGEIYDIGRQHDPSGGTGWFEGAHLEPDVLLEDVIKVVYPAVAPNHDLVWLRDMRDEGHGNAHSCAEYPDREGCTPDALDLAARCDHHAAHPLVNDGCPLDIDGHAHRNTVSIVAAALAAAAALVLAA